MARSRVSDILKDSELFLHSCSGKMELSLENTALVAAHKFSCRAPCFLRPVFM